MSGEGDLYGTNNNSIFKDTKNRVEKNIKKNIGPPEPLDKYFSSNSTNKKFYTKKEERTQWKYVLQWNRLIVEIRYNTILIQKSWQNSLGQHFSAIYFCAQISRQMKAMNAHTMQNNMQKNAQNNAQNNARNSAHNTDLYIRHRGSDVAKSRTLVPGSGLIIHSHANRGTANENNICKSPGKINDDFELTTLH